MYKRTLDAVVLVSSDSDFTRLAQRLREEGLVVYGFGSAKAVEEFRNACNRFIYVENLLETEPEGTKDEAGAATGIARQSGWQAHCLTQNVTFDGSVASSRMLPKPIVLGGGG